MNITAPYIILTRCFLNAYNKNVSIDSLLKHAMKAAERDVRKCLVGTRRKGLTTDKFFKVLYKFLRNNYPRVEGVIREYEPMLRSLFDGEYLRMVRYAEIGGRRIQYKFVAETTDGIVKIVPVFNENIDDLTVEPILREKERRAKQSAAAKSANKNQNNSDDAHKSQVMRGRKQATETIETVVKDEAELNAIRQEVNDITNTQKPQPYLDILVKHNIIHDYRSFAVALSLGYNDGKRGAAEEKRWNSAKKRLRDKELANK